MFIVFVVELENHNFLKVITNRPSRIYDHSRNCINRARECHCHKVWRVLLINLRWQVDWTKITSASHTAAVGGYYRSVTLFIYQLFISRAWETFTRRRRLVFHLACVKIVTRVKSLSFFLILNARYSGKARSFNEKYRRQTTYYFYSDYIFYSKHKCTPIFRQSACAVISHNVERNVYEPSVHWGAASRWLAEVKLRINSVYRSALVTVSTFQRGALKLGTYDN